MDEIYGEAILDAYRSARHRGALQNADVSFEDDNPLCGDRVRMEARLGPDDSITEVRFQAKGCAISQAAASMLCEHAAGRPRREVLAWDKKEVLDLIGITLSPIRLKCALLPLKVLQAALWRREATPS
jgi:nitrogen fixation NifU-like protein